MMMMRVGGFSIRTCEYGHSHDRGNIDYRYLTSFEYKPSRWLDLNFDGAMVQVDHISPHSDEGSSSANVVKVRTN